jgi:FixJ family two-component response regulator
VPGGIDGEAVRRLVQRAPDLPIIIMSGHHDLEPPVAAAARFDKPFDTRALLTTLEQLHERARAKTAVG